MMDSVILFKNSKQYSKIKFDTHKEAISFMEYYMKKGDPNVAKDKYDMFNSSTGEFEARYMFADGKFQEVVPTRKPRKRNF